MKTTISLTSLFVLVLSVTVFSFINTESQSKTVFASDVSTVPTSYEKVTYTTTNEEKAQARWLKLYDNLDGYTLEEANKIAGFIPKDSVPDCSCAAPDPANRLSPKRVGAEWICTDCPKPFWTPLTESASACITN